MNKIEKMLRASSKEIKDFRASILAESMQRAHARLVMNLEDELAALESKLHNISDMYPNSELTLRIVSKDFDPAQWVKDMQSLKVSILTKKVELRAADETTKEWFVPIEDSPEKIVRGPYKKTKTAE